MLKSLARAVLCLSVLVSVAGCYSVRITRPDVTPSSVSHVAIQHTFIYGILSLGSVNADAMCGAAPIQSVHTRIGGLGLIANALTMGLWAPMTVTVVCGEKAAGGGDMTSLPADGDGEALAE